jgi:hypothetical protein
VLGWRDDVNDPIRASAICKGRHCGDALGPGTETLLPSSPSRRMVIEVPLDEQVHTGGRTGSGTICETAGEDPRLISIHKKR